MDDASLLELVKAATELEGLEKIGAGRRVAPHAHAEGEIRGYRSIRRYGLPSVLGLAACAALIAVLLIPWGPFKTFGIVQESWRTPGGEPTYRFGLELRHPAYVRVVAFDGQGDWSLAPLDEGGTEHVRRVEQSISRSIGRVSHPGGGKVRFVMVIASPGVTPTEQDLLATMKTLDANQTKSDQEMARALKGIARDLETRFDCSVRFKKVP